MKRLIALLALAAALVACSPSDGGTSPGTGSTPGTDLGSPALESPAMSSPGMDSPAMSPMASPSAS